MNPHSRTNTSDLNMFVLLNCGHWFREAATRDRHEGQTVLCMHDTEQAEVVKAIIAIEVPALIIPRPPVDETPA